MADELEGFGDGEFGRGDRDDVPAGADGPGGVGGTAQDERGELGGQLFPARHATQRGVVAVGEKWQAKECERAEAADG